MNFTQLQYDTKVYDLCNFSHNKNKLAEFIKTCMIHKIITQACYKDYHATILTRDEILTQRDEQPRNCSRRYEN